MTELTAEELAKVACIWTALIDVEISSDQVQRMLAAVELVAPSVELELDFNQIAGRP